MATEKSHITVCICTFKRPDLLKRLLNKLDSQETEGLFSYSVVIADNDRMQSARQVVAEYVVTSSIPAIYCVEPEQNIALARNKALENAKGDFIGFIDDDEVPETDWLFYLFKTCKMYEVDGVLGPVKPYFEHEPPQWVLRGKFFERPTHETGYQLDWTETRTGNVLFKREILSGIHCPFRPDFGMGGEDVDFFGRMMQNGKMFVWCNEAIVYELVQPSRCKCSYLLRRAFLRGISVPKRSTHHIAALTKSVIAVPVYTIALPILAIFGKHVFINYLIKLFDHVSRILAYLGFKLRVERPT